MEVAENAAEDIGGDCSFCDRESELQRRLAGSAT